MRNILIDLSSDNYLEQPQIFGGYAGEHNETVLQVLLPHRMIGVEYSDYRFDFQTSEDNEIPIPVSKLDNRILSCHLTEQLTIAGKLLFNVVARKLDGNSVSLTSKTNMVALYIGESPDGNALLADPNGYKDELLNMIDERLLEIDPVGQETPQGGEVFNDYTNNNAIGTFSHSEGTNALSGSRAFTILAVDVANKTYTLDSVEGLEIGDIYSVHLLYNDDTSAQEENVGQITKIENNVVTVDEFYIEDGKTFATQDSYINEYGLDDELNTFRIVVKPLVGNRIIGFGAHSEGRNTKAQVKGSHAEGGNSVAYGAWSHAEGRSTKAGYSAHAEGNNTTAGGFNSHAEGSGTITSGWASHTEGASTEATGTGAHAEGNGTKALAHMAHSEGYFTTASGENSHTEGFQTQAINREAHAEGIRTLAEGIASHAEGTDTVANGWASHAGGNGTIAKGEFQTVVGKFNKEEGNEVLFIVGNGTSNTDRKNAFVVYKDGSVKIGDVLLSPANISYLLSMIDVAEVGQ